MTQGRCSVCTNGTSIFFASKKKMSISFLTRLNFVYLRWYITLIGKHEKIRLRGCPYGGELTRLGGLARVGEMIFIPRSYGIFYLSSIKKFVMSLEKDWSSSFYNKQWCKAIMQNICSYNKAKLIKENSIRPCRVGPLAHVHLKNFHLA